MKEKLKNMWAVKKDNHIYIYHNGELIYKRWVGKKGGKTQPSMLFNKHWPNVQIY